MHGGVKIESSNTWAQSLLIALIRIIILTPFHMLSHYYLLMPDINYHPTIYFSPIISVSQIPLSKSHLSPFQYIPLSISLQQLFAPSALIIYLPILFSLFTYFSSCLVTIVICKACLNQILPVLTVYCLNMSHSFIFMLPQIFFLGK